MARKRRRYDPFAPLNPRQQQAQARQYVNAQIQPLLKQINSEFARENQGQQNAISSATNALASQLMPQQQITHNYYQEAIGQQKGLDEALYQHLQGQGAPILQNQVGVDPSRSQALQNVAQNAAAANFAQGSSGLAALIAQGASAENYSSQLPNFARMGGAWRSAELNSQMENERAKQVGDIRSKIPGLVSGTLQDIQNRELQKAIAQQSGLVSQQKLFDTEANNAARIQQGRQRIAQGQQRLNLSAEANAERIRHNKAMEAKDKASGRDNSKFYVVQDKVSSDARRLAKGHTVTTQHGFIGSSKVQKHRAPIDIYRVLHGRYAPRLIDMGYSEQRIKEMILSEMYNAGIRNPTKLAGGHKPKAKKKSKNPFIG